MTRRSTGANHRLDLLAAITAGPRTESLTALATTECRRGAGGLFHPFQRTLRQAAESLQERRWLQYGRPHRQGRAQFRAAVPFGSIYNNLVNARFGGGDGQDRF